MAINIKFDLSGNAEPPTIILANRNGNKLGQLDVNIESIDLEDKLNDASEFSFTVNKYVDNKLTPLWDKLVDFKLIYCKEWDMWFEIAVELDEATETVKTVFCTQLGYAELSQIMLYDIEINTEKDIARDDYKKCILYDESDSGASLLTRLLEKAPHYSIAHVDSTIAGIQRSFSFDGTSIADALQEIGEEIGCLFVLNSDSDENGKPQRIISVYDLYQVCNDCKYRGEFTDGCPKCDSTDINYGYGKDTSIFVTADELASEGIGLVADTDSVKNCFKLEGGDDLMTATIRNCNPNGTDYIWYFSDAVKEDMPDGLVEKINEYDEKYHNYYTGFESKINNSSLVTKYNALINKYNSYREEDEKFQTINSIIVGYPSLMNAYYDSIDLALYLESGLMPTIKIVKTDAEKEANELTSLNLSPVAVANIATVSKTTADSAVLAMAKIFVKSTYKVQIGNSSLSADKSKWTGNFIVTNYSDEEDTRTTSNVSVTINGDVQTFVQQKIEKALNKEDTDDLSISGLFEKEYSPFCAELKKYALNPLTSFHDACQTCIDILIEQGVGNSGSNLYTELYEPYMDKLKAIENEMSLRESEINIISGVYDANGNLITKGLKDYIEKNRSTIQKDLDFQNYLGAEYWKLFSSYRREDKYSNKNYISDGLNNAELFKRAQEFIEVAENEIYKSSELQCSVSTTLNNLLSIPKFKPLVNSFNLGNWIRVQIDDKIYKLRLLEYGIDYGELGEISVEFSDVTKIRNGFTDVQDILSQASSMATSYDSVIRQAKQGEDAKGTIKKWISDGLSSALVKIQNNDNEEVTIGKNGLLCRSYNDITGSYSDEQLKLTHNIIAYTDDNWKTVRQVIGKYEYRTFDDTTGGFSIKDGYGITADHVTAGVVSGSQIVGGTIYSSNFEKKIEYLDGKQVVNYNGSYINLENGDFVLGGGALMWDAINNKLVVDGNKSNMATADSITTITSNWIKTAKIEGDGLTIINATMNNATMNNAIMNNATMYNARMYSLNAVSGMIGNWTVSGEDSGYDCGSLYSDVIYDDGDGGYRAWMHTPGFDGETPLAVYSVQKKVKNGDSYSHKVLFTADTSGDVYAQKISAKNINIGGYTFINNNGELSMDTTFTGGDVYKTFIQRPGYAKSEDGSYIVEDGKYVPLWCFSIQKNSDGEDKPTFYVNTDGDMFASNSIYTNGNICTTNGDIFTTEGNIVAGGNLSTNAELTVVNNITTGGNILMQAGGQKISISGDDASGNAYEVYIQSPEYVLNDSNVYEPNWVFAILKNNESQFIVKADGSIHTKSGIYVNGTQIA